MLELRNHCVYRDKEVRYDDNETIVKCTYDVKDIVIDEIKKYLNRIVDASNITPHIETMGKTKCDAVDSFDAKKGLIIASRKAEFKATNQTRKEITHLRQEVEEFLRFLEDVEDKVDYKAGRLSLDLVEFRYGMSAKELMDQARGLIEHKQRERISE